jgi:hypothetical protein
VLPFGGSTGALLVSPFNVKWRRRYVQAGGVEESQFCLFSVVFPVRCISSVSPRFYFRKHTFCFLPLAANLDSPCYNTILKTINIFNQSSTFANNFHPVHKVGNFSNHVLVRKIFNETFSPGM